MSFNPGNVGGQKPASPRLENAAIDASAADLISDRDMNRLCEGNVTRADLSSARSILARAGADDRPTAHELVCAIEQHLG